MPRVLRRVALSGRFGQPRDDDDVWRTVTKGLLLMAIDVAIVLGVAIALFYALSGYMISPVEHGFHCNDASIRKPFYPNTVTTTELLTISLGSPFAIIFVCEAVLFWQGTGSHRVAKFFTSSTFLILEYILSYAACTFIMEILKCGVGRLRPHFIAVCDVDWSKVDCSTDPNAFITDVVCMNTADRRVRVSRTSFPSGHTAAAAFFCFWLIQYIRGISRASGSRELNWMGRVLVVVVTGWTLFTAITRVTDNWHHPTDVLGGLILALLCIWPVFGRGRYSPDAVYERRDIFPPRVHFE